MREIGVRGRPIYCSDYHCSYWMAISADRWPDDVRLFAAVLLAWPWIDYFPTSLLLLGIFLNALIIYFVLAVVARAIRR
jgi:hypothetical protein